MACSSDTNPPIKGVDVSSTNILPAMDSVGKKKHGTVPGCPTWTSSEECQFLTRNSFLLESRWQGVRIWTWTIVCPVRPWSRHLTPVQKLAQGINSLFVFFVAMIQVALLLMFTTSMNFILYLNFKCGWIPSIFSMIPWLMTISLRIQIALMVETSPSPEKDFTGEIPDS